MSKLLEGVRRHEGAEDMAVDQIKKIKVDGLIGETSSFFKLPLKDVKELHIDMQSVTFINSIGVKFWLNWTAHIPTGCRIYLHKCPFVIVSQGSSVYKFLPANFFVESFFAYFNCAKCEAEVVVQLNRGEHFEYASKTQESWYKLPENLKCDKCEFSPLEADFFPEKTFKFLNPEK